MTPRLYGTLLVLCGALFLDGLDISMVGVALPSIQADLGLSNSALQWIVSGYVLGYGGLLLLGGRAADLLGRRQVFLWAIGVFAVASLLGGLVDDPNLLIGTRFIKGVAAAFTAPAGLSIITTTFHEGPARNKALSFYTACGASGFSMGLILGGLLTEAGWRWTFLLPAPIALVILIAGIKLIPKHRTERPAGAGYDLGGAATSTAALLLLVYAVVEAPDAGWLSTRTLGSFDSSIRNSHRTSALAVTSCAICCLARTPGSSSSGFSVTSTGPVKTAPSDRGRSAKHASVDACFALDFAVTVAPRSYAAANDGSCDTEVRDGCGRSGGRSCRAHRTARGRGVHAGRGDRGVDLSVPARDRRTGPTRGVARVGLQIDGALDVVALRNGASHRCESRCASGARSPSSRS